MDIIILAAVFKHIFAERGYPVLKIKKGYHKKVPTWFIIVETFNELTQWGVILVMDNKERRLTPNLPSSLFNEWGIWDD